VPHILLLTLEGSLSLFLAVLKNVYGIFWVFVLAFVAERFLPIEDSISGRSMRLNYIVGFFALLFEQLGLVSISYFLVRPMPSLSSVFTISDSSSFGKAFAVGFCWFVTRDFFYYWFHRLQHASKWLWAEHALHHSEEQVNVTTSIRHHWLDKVLELFFILIPLQLIFRPPFLALATVGGILGMVGFSNHMNFKFGLGRLNWLITTPQSHRIHHSRLPEHLDKNFAAFFPLWDMIFGTYHAPAKDEYPPTGLSSGERVTTTRQALLLPFTMWRKMISGNAK